MPASASGEVKTHISHQPRKNGDIYVFERRRSMIRLISTTRFSPAGSSQKVQTEKIPRSYRLKRGHVEKSSNSKLAAAVSATCLKDGMMDIIDHIGDVSGINDAVYGNTDIGTAQKVLSLDRYLLAMNDQSLPGILTWQFTHSLPYEDGISEDIYHDLFEQVGRDESLQQNFFLSRCAGIKGKAVLVYDSTTISTYSGNLPDVITIENALKQLDFLGLANSKVVTDNGYYSEQNLADILHTHFDLITLSKVSTKWVKKELKAHIDEFRQTASVCPCDTNIHGITVTLMHNFSYKRKYASRKKGIPEGGEETSTRRIYLHLFFNPTKCVEAEDAVFDRTLHELKNHLEGTAVGELPASSKEKEAKYLHILH